MVTLLIRTVIVYLLIFTVVRLMGKRQISDMQPFDLVITLLLADLASTPISDPGIPLLYGIIPILTLFILHRAVAFLALRSDSVRGLVCGHSIMLIEKGAVNRRAMRAANYTLSDLMEQLRIKDVFSFSEVDYAILETNGTLSVLKNGSAAAPNEPSVLLVSDGKPVKEALRSFGFTEDGLASVLSASGIKSFRDCLFVCLECPTTLNVQVRRSCAEPKVKSIELKEAHNAGA